MFDLTKFSHHSVPNPTEKASDDCIPFRFHHLLLGDSSDSWDVLASKGLYMVNFKPPVSFWILLQVDVLFSF